ncbi:MAG: glycosyltransferase family 4 protein [Beijerinckiaceae bacterium]
MDARLVNYELPGKGSPRERKPLVLLNHMVESPGKVSGIGRYAFALIEALLQRGRYRYALATSWTQEELPAAIADRLDTVITLPHIRSTPVSFFNQLRQLSRLSRTLKPDFVYSVNPMCPAIPGVPTAVTVHDLYYDVMPELYSRRHVLWWRSYFALAAHHVHTIACVSQNTANDLARFHPRHAAKTAIVPGAGVLPAPQNPAPRAQDAEPYILLLGNVTPNKNVPFLIEALGQLAREGRPVRAIHVGRDLSGDLARALAAGPPGLLEIRGGLNDGELDALMRNAAALVQPSLYEGFGLPIIEAHERGVPVIASDIAIFREVAGEGAEFVPLGGTAALAQSLSRMVRDPIAREALAAKAKANAARYSWNASAAAAERVIAAALQPARA